MATVASRWKRIQAEIEQIASKPVTVVAVSKQQPIAKMQDAFAAGLRHFGESYVQEALSKMATWQERTNVVWHFIGPIQSNKTKHLAEHFDWVQSVDRLKVARRLNDQRPSHLPPLNVLIQVNISGEPSKSGVHPDEVLPLAQAIRHLPRLSLRGLMTIPSPNAPMDQWQSMLTLFQQLSTYVNTCDTLSMGMSNDYATAIRYGATMIRLGTALFGPRSSNRS